MELWPGEVGTKTELGEKEGSETHSSISTCKTAHIQHLAPRERSMLKNMFPCTDWASFQLLCAHVPAALSALLEKHKKQRKYLHVQLCTVPSLLPATSNRLIRREYTLITGSTLPHLVTQGLRHLKENKLQHGMRNSNWWQQPYSQACIDQRTRFSAEHHKQRQPGHVDYNKHNNSDCFLKRKPQEMWLTQTHFSAFQKILLLQVHTSTQLLILVNI